MSVERNYTFRISATPHSDGRQSERRKSAEVASENSTDEGLDASKAFKRESDGVVDEFHNMVLGSAQLSRTALIRETADISATERPGRIASQSAFSEPLEKQPTFSNEPLAVSVGEANPHVVESHGISTVPNIGISGELAEELRKLHSLRAQAINRQESAEALSVIRQIRDMFLEQQRESVTRQELKRELQTLRLVMEGRK